MSTTRDANFTDEQHQLAEVASELFATVNPSSRVRALGEEPGARDRKVWKRLAEMGLTGIGVPVEQGGMGGDARDLVMVLEQAGRHLLPEPLAATVAVAVPVLAASDDPDAGDLLAAIGSGESLATISFEDVPHVLDVDDAELVLAERENTLWLDGPAAEATRLRTEDASRRAFTRPDLRGRLLGTADLLAEARLRSTAATAAELVGVCAGLLDQCVDYAKVRRQFDTPIGAFQAVQHVLADLFVAVESARGAVRHAARAVALGTEDRRLAVHIAKAAANDAHERVNRDALQVFGGIGFTWEHDLHLWLKRGLALAAQDGHAREHRAAVAAALLD